MKSFEGNFDSRLPLTHDLVQAIMAIGEFRGRSAMHTAQIPQILDTLKNAAIIQSTESSNRIEGIVAPTNRLRSLLADKTTPKDRSEQEILGYRDVLNTIHGCHDGMNPTDGLTQQLHRDMMKHTNTPGGVFKPTPNDITELRPGLPDFVRFQTVPPHQVKDYMRTLHEQFNRLIKEGKVSPLFLISAYILDFLCIHPFSDGNGRMARLLTTLLLYRSGFDVCRYVSLEKAIEKSKESYYDTLYQSSQGWHEGTHNLRPWTEYMLGLLTGVYRDFETRVGILTCSKGAKTGMILAAIQQFRGEFTIAELMEQCPGVSVDMIRTILAQEKHGGKIERIGSGRGSKWIKKN